MPIVLALSSGVIFYNTCFKVLIGRFRRPSHGDPGVRPRSFLARVDVFLVLGAPSHSGSYSGHLEYYV